MLWWWLIHFMIRERRKTWIQSSQLISPEVECVVVFTFSTEKYSYEGKKSRTFPFSLPAVSCKINMSPRVRSCWESVLSRAPPPPIGMDHHLCQSSHLGDELRAYSLHLYSSLFELPFEALFLFSLNLSCYKLWFEL